MHLSIPALSSCPLLFSPLPDLEGGNMRGDSLLQPGEHVRPVLLRVPRPRLSAAGAAAAAARQGLQVALDRHQLVLKRFGDLVELRGGVVAKLLPLDAAVQCSS